MVARVPQEMEKIVAKKDYKLVFGGKDAKK
jgi:hypothetical protein